MGVCQIKNKNKNLSHRQARINSENQNNNSSSGYPMPKQEKNSHNKPNNTDNSNESPININIKESIYKTKKDKNIKKPSGTRVKNANNESNNNNIQNISECKVKQEDIISKNNNVKETATLNEAIKKENDSFEQLINQVNNNELESCINQRLPPADPNIEIFNFANLKDDTSPAFNQTPLYIYNEFRIVPEDSYSTESDFSSLIHSSNFHSKAIFVTRLLSTKERHWNKENILLSDFIKRHRASIDSFILNKYLNMTFLLHEHFNWLVWALSYYYSNAWLNQKPNWFTDCNFFLPNVNSWEWINGFQWKGLFIKVQTYDNSKKLFNEVKALNYTFFDYILLLDQYKTIHSTAKYLSNEIVFPLFSYCIFGGLVLFATTLINEYKYDCEGDDNKNCFRDISDCISNINKNYANDSIDEIIELDFSKNTNWNKSKSNNNNNNNNISNTINKGVRTPTTMDKKLTGTLKITVNEDVNISWFNRDDWNKSSIFVKIKNENFIKIIDEWNGNTNKSNAKYWWTNARNLIPNWYESDGNKMYSLDTANLGLSAIKYYDIYSGNSTILKEFTNTNHEKIKWNKIENSILNLKYRVIFQDNPSEDKFDSGCSTINNNNTRPTNYFFLLPLVQNRVLIEKINSITLSSNPILKYFTDMSSFNIPDTNIVIFESWNDIKQKYSLINIPENSKLKIKDFFKHIDTFCVKLNTKSHEIRTVEAWKNYFHKYGINLSFAYFVLLQISHKMISDWILIYIYTSTIKRFFFYHEGINLLLKLGWVDWENEWNIYSKSSFEDIQGNGMQSMNDIKKIKIMKIIKAVLFLNSNANPEDRFIQFYYKQISFFLMVKTLKLKKLNMEFNLNLFSDAESKGLHTELLLKCTKACIDNPFVFISSLETLLNIRVDPFWKYRASISLNNLNIIRKDHITIFDPHVMSYVDIHQLSAFSWCKCIAINNWISLKKTLNNNLITELNNSRSSVNIVPHFVNNQNMKNDVNSPLSQSVNSHVKDIDLFNDENPGHLKTNSNWFNLCNPKTNDTWTTYQNNRWSNYWKPIISWKDIFPKISLDMLLRGNVFKMYSTKNIKRGQCSSKELKGVNIYKNLSSSYRLTKPETLVEWKTNIEVITRNVISCNQQVENVLSQVYIFDFWNNYFIDDNYQKSMETLHKLKKIFTRPFLYTYNWAGIINIIEGWMMWNTDNSTPIQTEEYYAKCLIYLLWNYGDMRGKNIKCHPFTLIPWHYLCNTIHVNDHSDINENLIEMLRCMEYNINGCNYINGWLKHGDNNRFISQMYKPNLLYYPTYSNNNNCVNCNNANDDDGEVNDKNYYFVDICSIDDCPVWKGINFPGWSTGNMCRGGNNANCSVDTNIEGSFFETKDYILFFISSVISWMSDMKNTSPLTLNEELSVLYQLDLTSESRSMSSQSQSNQNKRSKNTNINANANKNIKNTFTSVSNYPGKIMKQPLSSYVSNEWLNKMGYKKYAPDGIVVSFGANFHSETSYDNNNHLYSPRLNYKWSDYQIDKIFSGYEHSVVIDTDKNIFAFGNNLYGQCGVGQTDTVNSPTLVIFDISDNKKEVEILDVGIGSNFTLFLTSEGELYQCGYNLSRKKNEYVPTKIELNGWLGNDDKVIQISCGVNFSVWLTKNGFVYTWGIGREGQLGHSIPNDCNNKDYILTTPTRVKQLNSKIKQITTGDYHTIVLTQDNRLYGWGLSEHGELGWNFCNDSLRYSNDKNFQKEMKFQPISRVILPRFITDSHSTILSITSAHHSSFFITQHNNDRGSNIFACGYNDKNQLSIDNNPGSCCDIIVPSKIDYFCSMNIVKVACGEKHSLGIVKMDMSLPSILSWGDNSYGQLGCGKRFTKTFPKPINYIIEFTNSVFKDVACGKNHSMVLLGRKDSIGQEWDIRKIWDIIKDISNAS